MKNVIQSLAIVSAALFLTSCKNDKPAANSTSENVAESVTSSPSLSTAESLAEATDKAADATQNLKAAVGSVEKVMPSQEQINPTPPQSTTKAQTTSIKFDEMSYDWGTIKEGDKMTHIFKFKNTGNHDLIISDARGSCGCTVPEWPKEPIKPGKGGDIKVVFDSAHKSGQQSKTVTIAANTEPASIVLMIKGVVEAKEEKKATN
jgi:hypothetical protein